MVKGHEIEGNPLETGANIHLDSIHFSCWSEITVTLSPFVVVVAQPLASVVWCLENTQLCFFYRGVNCIFVLQWLDLVPEPATGSLLVKRCRNPKACELISSDWSMNITFPGRGCAHGTNVTFCWVKPASTLLPLPTVTAHRINPFTFLQLHLHLSVLHSHILTETVRTIRSTQHQRTKPLSPCLSLCDPSSTGQILSLMPSPCTVINNEAF